MVEIGRLCLSVFWAERERRREEGGVSYVDLRSHVLSVV